MLKHKREMCLGVDELCVSGGDQATGLGHLIYWKLFEMPNLNW